MRIQVVSAAVMLSLCGITFDAAAQPVCMKPWAVADKWIDNHDETEPIDQIWTPNDTFETVDAHGNPLPDADVYIPAVTGFSFADIGRRVWLKVGDAGTATQGWFFAIDIGGAGAGANAYRTAIATCDPAAPNFVQYGDLVPVLMGNLHGPTLQGVMDLISQDVDAYWNDVSRSVVSTHPVSPRLAAIAAFDPAQFEQYNPVSGPLQVQVTNFLGVFVEGYVNGYVIGVLTPIPGQ
jgi:hypothetical protein